MLKLILSCVLILSSCGPSYNDYPCIPAYGCVSETQIRLIRPPLDPDPLCRFRKRKTSIQLFEKMMSNDPFDLYEEDDLKSPYRSEFDQQQQQKLPQMQFRSCLLSDLEVEYLNCKDQKCKQDKSQLMQKQQMLEKEYLIRNH